MEPSDERYLKLSFLRAMLDNVPRNMKAITASIEGHVIRIRAYFDNDVTDEDREALSLIAGEVIADYPAPFVLEEESLPISAGLSMLDYWIFLRKD